MREPKVPKKGDVKAPAVIAHLHASIQKLPEEARQNDIYLKQFEAALKLIVESDKLHPVFNQLEELAPYPHPDLRELGSYPHRSSAPTELAPYPTGPGKTKCVPIAVRS